MAKINFTKSKETTMHACERCGQVFEAFEGVSYCPDCASVLYEEQLIEAQEEYMDPLAH